MPYQPKPGRGQIFRDRKKTNPNAPDFRSPDDATVMVDGVEREVRFALWLKHSEKVGEFFSYSIEIGNPSVSANDEVEDPEFVR